MGTFFLTWTTSVVLVLVTVIQLQCTQAKKSLYGEPCNVGQKCDARAYLSCQDGICGCIKSEEMIYEKTYQKCVSKSGERCTFAVNEDGYQRTTSRNGNGTSTKNPNPRDRENSNYRKDQLIFEPTQCVPNATCTAEGVCVCDKKFYEDPSGSGLCILGQGHLEPCDSLIRCSDHQRLTCQLGRCQCDKSKSTYSMKDPTDPHCVGLPGHPCIHSKCAPHSTCSTFGNLCRCDDDYFHDHEDKCVLKLGHMQNCTGDFQCQNKGGNKFVCLKGQCVCDPKSSRYGAARASLKYDDDFHKFHGYTGPTHIHCVGLVGSDCIEGLCTTNSYCSYANSEVNDNSGVCRCTPDYSESKGKSCGRDFGQYCDPHTCIDDFTCYESRCACRYENQIYDEASRTCKSPIGGPCNNATFSCGPRSICSTVKVPRSHSQIQNQSQIQSQSHSLSLNIEEDYHRKILSSRLWMSSVVGGHGHCVCQEGFVENSKGICEKSFGKSCDDNSECDTVALLKCMDGTCQCRGFAEYSERFRKCLGMVGAKCNVTEMVLRQCTDHAECAQSHPDMPGSCRCKEGFIETPKYNCVKRVGIAKP